MGENEIIAAMAMLKDQGITSFEVDFSGSGDSGDIDERRYYNGKDEIDPNDDVIGICEQIEDVIINNYYHYDWYNNEGGRGTLYVDLESKTWNIEGVQYVQREEDASEDGCLMDVLNHLKS